MGNLIIKRVIYSGEKYSFTSPEFTVGINIIVGDNGSGKSTFSHFITYGLGGSVAPFNPSSKQKKQNNSKYSLITEDTNNYVILEISINGEDYILKRFIGSNDVFFEEKGEINKLPIKRDIRYAPRTFSDWLLEKLGIKVFELYLGASSWLIGFKDLYRLLYHDQDSDPRKIFKEPSAENYIADSSIIRKSIFEILIGVSSEEYNIKFNDFKEAERKKNESKSIFDSFNRVHYYLKEESLHKRKNKLLELENQLKKLNSKRDSYQKENTNTNDKTGQLTNIQAELIELEIAISDNSIIENNYEIEKNKIKKLLDNQKNEISQIEKIIFTHDKLNLFSLEICPFCMSDVDPKIGHCICGSEIKDDDYEKFVYKSSEYKEIFDHKNKSLKSIETAFESYNSELSLVKSSLKIMKEKAFDLKESLKKIINSIEFSGNSQLIDKLNDKILEVREEILITGNIVKLLEEKNILEDKEKIDKSDFDTKKTEYEKMQKEFSKNNKETIKEFSEIYSKLLSKSSASSNYAEINDDYMPYIDRGEYKERSTIVPIRLMYYFTLLSMGLKRDTVKHPRFLLIDTPERGGIDKSRLKDNLMLLNEALELSQKGQDNRIEKLKDYQVILTTGKGKYPDKFEKYVKLRFDKEDKEEYILKKKVDEL
ncbi:AAA family ATPase [Winogradskyella pacifica]|uniref:AAA family ATPase n=1 Tax=Winogradskyella pacifica TaxID=664642 RepID=UPI0015C95F2F|nr:AAA family ATPase [Winogradskyella pacifica]